MLHPHPHPRMTVACDKSQQPQQQETFWPSWGVGPLLVGFPTGPRVSPLDWGTGWCACAAGPGSAGCLHRSSAGTHVPASLSPASWCPRPVWEGTDRTGLKVGLCGRQAWSIRKHHLHGGQETGSDDMPITYKTGPRGASAEGPCVRTPRSTRNFLTSPYFSPISVGQKHKDFTWREKRW